MRPCTRQCGVEGRGGGTWSFERIAGRGGRTARAAALHAFDAGGGARVDGAAGVRFQGRVPPPGSAVAEGFRGRLKGAGRGSRRPRMGGGSTGRPVPAGGD